MKMLQAAIRKKMGAGSTQQPKPSAAPQTKPSKPATPYDFDIEAAMRELGLPGAMTLEMAQEQAELSGALYYAGRTASDFPVEFASAWDEHFAAPKWADLDGRQRLAAICRASAEHWVADLNDAWSRFSARIAFDGDDPKRYIASRAHDEVARAVRLRDMDQIVPMQPKQALFAPKRYDLVEVGTGMTVLSVQWEYVGESLEEMHPELHAYRQWGGSALTVAQLKDFLDGAYGDKIVMRADLLAHLSDNGEDK